jgi:flagellar basal-body rod protein FlgB
MTDPIFSDKAFLSAEIALDGLSRRQEAIGKNIANVDTPGYHAENITFEDSLNRALQSSASLTLEKTDSSHLGLSSDVQGFQLQKRQGGTERADGNNVDINVELSQMGETSLRYQALSQAVSKKLAFLKNLAVSR